MPSRFPKALPRSFKGLSRLLPPVPIHDEDAYGLAQELTDRLNVMGELAKGQEQYLETLTVLMADYERSLVRIEWNHHDPVDNLERLMDTHGLSPNALGDLLGQRSLGARILRRERSLGSKHVRILCERFEVPAEVFEGPGRPCFIDSSR